MTMRSIPGVARGIMTSIQGEDTMSRRTFEEWMKLVDVRLYAKFRATSEDLGDACYHDMYDDGLTPAQAASQVIAEIKSEWEG